jgi:hypothetical protein
MVTFLVNKCLIVIIIPLTIAKIHSFQKRHLFVRDYFFLPDKDMVSIDIFYFFEAIPCYPLQSKQKYGIFTAIRARHFNCYLKS